MLNTHTSKYHFPLKRTNTLDKETVLKWGRKYAADDSIKDFVKPETKISIKEY